MPTNAELKALEAHKPDMAEMTYYRYRQRLPIQIERLKRLPLLARAIADEAERIAKESTQTKPFLRVELDPETNDYAIYRGEEFIGYARTESEGWRRLAEMSRGLPVS